MTPDLARRVAITGVGVVGSFGSGTGALWDCAAPPVVSTKGHIGHAMGAAAMFDVALGMEMFRRGRAPAAFAAAGDFSDGIRSILCTGIGLNGLFGAVLVRRAHWQGEGVRWFPG